MQQFTIGLETLGKIVERVTGVPSEQERVVAASVRELEQEGATSEPFFPPWEVEVDPSEINQYGQWGGVKSEPDAG